VTRACCVISFVLALLPGRVQAQVPDTDALAQALAAVSSGVGVPSIQEPERYEPTTRSDRRPRFRPAVEQWYPLVAGYGWDAEQALAVISCESGGDPGAVNRSSGAAGLLQLLGWSWLARRLFGTGDVLDPAVNVGTGFFLWRDSGGTFRLHWAASYGCWG
jgi:soluble lytic murein transglycosylase-like protein